MSGTRTRKDDQRLQSYGWKTEMKRPVGRPKLRWKDNIRMDLRE